MITLTDHVTLWLEQDRPVRLYWREQRWRVTDSPTPLYADADDVPPLITHPPKSQTAWRIRVISEEGDRKTLIVSSREGGGWGVRVLPN